MGRKQIRTEDLPLQDPDQDRLEGAATVAFFTLFAAATIAVAYLLFDFVSDFIFALLFASMFAGTYEKILGYVRGRKWLASSLVCFIVVIIVAIPSTFVVGSLSAEVASVVGANKEAVSQISPEWLEKFLHENATAHQAVDLVKRYAGVDLSVATITASLTKVAGSVGGFVYARINELLANTFAVLFHFVIMLLILFYLLIDGKRLKSFLYLLSPLPSDEEEMLATKFREVGRAIVVGNGVGSLIQGVLGGIAMAVAGVPSPVLWGLVMTIFAFLPVVGITIVVIPAAIYLAAIGNYGAAIAFLIFSVVMATFVENVVKTKLIGDRMKMHNLLIFLSLIGGISVFSIIGLLYGPLIVALFLTLQELYQKHYKQRLTRGPAG